RNPRPRLDSSDSLERRHGKAAANKPRALPRAGRPRPRLDSDASPPPAPVLPREAGRSPPPRAAGDRGDGTTAAGGGGGREYGRHPAGYRGDEEYRDAPPLDIDGAPPPHYRATPPPPPPAAAAAVYSPRPRPGAQPYYGEQDALRRNVDAGAPPRGGGGGGGPGEGDVGQMRWGEAGARGGPDKGAPLSRANGALSLPLPNSSLPPPPQSATVSNKRRLMDSELDGGGGGGGAALAGAGGNMPNAVNPPRKRFAQTAVPAEPPGNAGGGYPET
ncbi:unnamed protein product, partial [Laminaria digitata]